MYEIGSIILLKKIIFKTTRKNNVITSRCTIDHAHRRPAIIIAEDEDFTYFLHITSKKFKHSLLNQHYIGSKDEQLIGGFACLEAIQKRNLCYRNEIMRIENSQLREILIKFCEYEENKNIDNEKNNIKQKIYDKINELDCVKVKKQKM